ncbi:unnamed protein product [Nesidiocoris tenuis]|uniref:Uncharacterized protein n=1 Tax=Nesidiocoris tenuis TaxID=355587 RepID=A0A6H5FZ71_9HEMI|nr:unnamed protein product [Nesidiocoris tenuis]
MKATAMKQIPPPQSDVDLWSDLSRVHESTVRPDDVIRSDRRGGNWVGIGRWNSAHLTAYLAITEPSNRQPAHNKSDEQMGSFLFGGYWFEISKIHYDIRYEICIFKLIFSGPSARLPPPDRHLKHSASCCGQLGKRDVERTWSDTGHYARPRPVMIYCEERGNGIEKQYVKYEKNFSPEPLKHSYCTLKREEHPYENSRRREDNSDMDYYTAASSDGGVSTDILNSVKILEIADVHREQTPKNTLVKESSSKKSSVSEHNGSQESGFDERRDSTSSQEQSEKSVELVTQKLERAKEIGSKAAKPNKQQDMERAAVEVMRELTETIVEGNHQIKKEERLPPRVPTINKAPCEVRNGDSNMESVTLVSNHRLSRKELNNEINKFIGKRGKSASALNNSSPDIANGGPTFVEEEYSYEPENKRSSSKLVMRTRSLLNLDEETKRPRNSRLIRPTAAKIKITTGPDGTFVIDGRKATSELNLCDDNHSDSNSEPKTERLLAGEELRRRKEEIFKNINAPPPPKDANRYNEEINRDNAQSTKEIAINNLKKYLKENKIGLKELLTNKNVVIIEPYSTGAEIKDISEYNHRNAEFDQSCRITGGTTKDGVEISCDEPSSNNNTLPRASKPHQPQIQRHYFYHLIKSKADPKEEDLPDPDQVKSTREKFQKEGKIRSPHDKDIMLPIAAKIVTPFKSNQSKRRVTPEVRVIYDPKKPTSPDAKKNNNIKKWTDTGSLSSGVSSDMSCFDNEDNNFDDLSHKGYSSDDEEETETSNKQTEVHPVSPEVMQKIRACGTTVTYYGGRVISHSHGPIRSPMTMTIMDEIRQGKEANKARTREMYMGIKFRLIKSNSCGSRLELAGADDVPSETSRNRFYVDMYGKSIGEELAESRSKLETMEEEMVNVDEQANNYARVHEEFERKFGKGKKKSAGTQSWRALIESRKQTKVREMRQSQVDMEFEEFQVASDN